MFKVQLASAEHEKSGALKTFRAVRDTMPPEIKISSPEEGFATRYAALDLSGTLRDDNIAGCKDATASAISGTQEVSSKPVLCQAGGMFRCQIDLPVGTIDEDPEQGMAITRERKLAVARRSWELLTGKHGLGPEDII